MRLAFAAALLLLVAPTRAFAQDLPPLPSDAEEEAAKPEPAPSSPPKVPAPPPRSHEVPVVDGNAEASPQIVQGENPLGQVTPAPHEVRLRAGGRVAYVTSNAFDAFSKNDVFPAFAADATITLLRAPSWSLAAGLGFDVGGRSSGLRGFSSELSTWRVTVPIEARWHHTAWLFSFLKAAPGAGRTTVRIDDHVRALEGSAAAFVTDVSLGASVAFPMKPRPGRRVRFELTPEVGYGFATASTLKVDPGRDPSDVTGTDAQSSLGSLSLAGFFWRASAGLSF